MPKKLNVLNPKASASYVSLQSAREGLRNAQAAERRDPSAVNRGIRESAERSVLRLANRYKRQK